MTRRTRTEILKNSFRQSDWQRMELKQMKAHQQADANCGRDWNSKQGCLCAICRTYKAKGVTV